MISQHFFRWKDKEFVLVAVANDGCALMKDEEKRHEEMVNSLALFSRNSSGANLEVTEEFVAGLLAPGSLLGKRQRVTFEDEF